MVWNVRPGFPSWLSNSSTSLLCVSLIALYSKLDLKLMKPNIHSIDLFGDVRNVFMFGHNLKKNLWFDHLSSLLWFVLLNCLVELMFADNLSTQTAHGRVHCLLSQICWVSQVLLCCETKFLETITHNQPEGDGDGIKYSSQKYNHWNPTSKVLRAEWLAKIPPYFTSWEFDFDSSWLHGKKIMKLILNESGSAVKGSLILWT